MDGLFPLPPDTPETDAHVRRDIAFLSALLKDYRSGTSTVLDAKQASGSRSDLWSHVSYFLVSGGSLDEYDNNVVAVVGRIEPGSLSATVVAQNTSPEHSGKKRKNRIQVDKVVSLKDGEIKSMLNDTEANVGTLP